MPATRSRATRSTSTAQPATGPGKTTTSSKTLAVGQQGIQNLTMPANAQALAIVAEASAGAPYKLAVLNASGSVIGTVNASPDGTATLQMPVAARGVYAIQLVNLGAGPIGIWSAATPQVKR